LTKITFFNIPISLYFLFSTKKYRRIFNDLLTPSSFIWLKLFLGCCSCHPAEAVCN